MVEAIALAVSEAATNSVLHAFVGMEPGEIRVTGWTEDDGTLRIEVVDDGRGMGPRLDSPGLGLGLPLISRMSRSVSVEAGPGGRGTCVQMCFDVDSRFDEPGRLGEDAAA